jgi:Domain of unknown function (DUF4169)
MPDTINLRQARKAKARAQHEKAATQNRATFGQSKANKALNNAVSNLADRRLDAMRCDGEKDA